jgi:hypothetical protein
MYNENLAFLGPGLGLILWLLSPIALIVACVRLTRARNNLAEEVKRLRAELLSRNGLATAGPTDVAEAPADRAVAATGSGAVGPSPPGTAPRADESSVARQTVAPEPIGERATQGIARRRNTVNPLNVVFIVGALFIIAAGIIFASTTWRELGTMPRIATLGSVAVLFFAASGLARKRFNLRSTGAAFFTLGCVFLPVAFIASGLLGLFGESFAASGERAFLLYAGASALLGATTLRGSLLYRSRAFAWAFLSSLTALVAFLAASLNNGFSTLALALAVYSAIPVVAIEVHARLGNVLANHRTIHRFARRFRESPFARPFGPFAALNVLAATVLSFIDRGGINGPDITFAILAVLFLSRVFNDPRHRHSGIGVYPFALCLALWITGLPGTETVPSVMLASALVMTVGLAGIVPDRIRKASTIASILAIAWGAVSAISYQREWSVQLIVALAILSIVSGLRARSGDRAFRTLHPAILVVLAFGSAEAFGHSATGAYVVAGIALLAVLFACGPLKLRSRVSDAVFLAALLLDFLVLRGRGSVSGQIALFAANVAGILWVARREPLARYAAPHYAILGCLATESLFARDRYAAVAWYALVAALGSAERFLKARLRVPEAALSFRIALSFWGAVAVVAGIAGSDLSAYHAIPWLAFAYWLASYIASGRKEPLDLWIAGALFLASPLASALSLTESRAIAPQWALFAPALASLALLVPESVPRIVRNHAERKVLFALSVGGIQVLGVAASMAYLDDHGLPLAYCVAALAVTATGYAIAHAKGASVLGAIPLFLVCAYPRRVSPDLLPSLSGAFASGSPEFLGNLLLCALFFLCVALSRVLHRELYARRADGRVSLDAFALIAPIAPVALVVSGADGLVPHGDRWVFAGLAFLAVAAHLFRRRTDNQWVDRAALSVSIAAVAAALVLQPFFAVPDVLLDEWRVLIPLAALVLATRFAWRGHEKVPGWIAFAWGCACIAILSWKAMHGKDGVDAIILGIGSLGVFVASFSLKLKRIFILSAITLIGLALYLSREFWVSLAWWIYLLSAGVSLISFAVANETMRKRGSGIASKAANLFAEWRW